MDLFEKVSGNMGPLGQYADQGYGYFTFPKLEGEIGNRMYFRGKPVLVWSLNNYLGLVIAAILITIRNIGDTIDGKIARGSGIKSSYGG